MKRQEEMKTQEARVLDILEGERVSPFGVRFDPVQGGGAQRLHMIRESFIREMTRLAITHSAINLSQGFPDFAPPKLITDALARIAAEGPHQYSITYGAEDFREALSRGS